MPAKVADELETVPAYRPYEVESLERAKDDLLEERSSHELLVWVRGPYRNLGIGRDCLGTLVDQKGESSSKEHKRESPSEFANDAKIPLETYICNQLISLTPPRKC